MEEDIERAGTQGGGDDPRGCCFTETRVERVGRRRKLSTVLNAAERSNKVTAGVSSQRAAVAEMRSFCPSGRAGAWMLKLLVGLVPCDYPTCIHVGVWRSNI